MKKDMKKEVILSICTILAVGLPFLINAKCTHTNYPGYIWSIYLAALFLYWICWAACCYLEKNQPSILSIVGANLGMSALVFCIVIAFINIKWWIVLLFLPFSWVVGGWIGGKFARSFHAAAWLWVLLCTAFLSIMVHAYYKF